MEQRSRELETELEAYRRENARLKHAIRQIAHEIEATSELDVPIDTSGGTERLPPHILIVEDDRSCADIIARLLSAHGYVARIASSGQDALRLLRSQRYDAVLLDIMMPEMDGYEVCAQMQADEELRRIPVIMVTARTGSEEMVRGLQLGAADYVTKPFHNKVLLARIEAVLRRYRRVA
jgi:DNA-binding response OmpR family regulator